MTVKAILAAKGSNVVTVDAKDSLAAASKTLTEKRVGAALILGIEGRIAGILSERDIVRAIGERGAKALDITVGEVMTRNVTTCGEQETVAQIMGRMTTGKFRHMPVVTDGKLIGIISIGDVVKRRVGEMENETQALQDYIRTA